MIYSNTAAAMRCVFSPLSYPGNKRLISVPSIAQNLFDTFIEKGLHEGITSMLLPSAIFPRSSASLRASTMRAQIYYCCISSPRIAPTIATVFSPSPNQYPLIWKVSR